MILCDLEKSLMMVVIPSHLNFPSYFMTEIGY